MSSNKISLILKLLFIALLFSSNISCVKNNSAETVFQMSLPTNPYEIPLGWSFLEVPVTGGMGKYSLQKIMDSTILSGHFRTDNVLVLTGLRKGTTTIEISDELGSSSGKITINVKDFVIRPTSLNIRIRNTGYIKVYTLNKYSVLIKDTSIISNRDKNSNTLFYAKNFGNTVVEFFDSVSLSKYEAEVRVIEWNRGEVSFESNVTNFKAKNGSVNDQYVNSVVSNGNDFWIISESIKNTDTTYILSFGRKYLNGITIGSENDANMLLYVNNEPSFTIKSHLVITSYNDFNISGTFYGSGHNHTDTAKNITIINGSFNTDYYKSFQ